MRTVLARGFALILAVAGPSAAEELAPSSSFVINFTSIVVNGEPTISTGPSSETGLYEGVLTASNSAGEGLLHNLTGRCMGKFDIDTEAGVFEQHGNCVYTDADGDQIWEQFDFEPQQLSPVQIAAGRWTGGSGKYEGLRGEFEIRVRPLRPANPSFGQVIGSKEGSYRISASN